MIIQVTQEHIDQGKIGNCNRCPVALALNKDKAFTALQIGNSSICRRGHFIAELPKNVMDFISNFDSYPENPYRKVPVPFEFHVSAEVFMP